MSNPFDAAVVRALLGAASDALRGGREVPPADALSLYALSHFLQEPGIGERPAWEVSAEATLQDSRILTACIEGMRSATGAYAASLDLLISGHSGLPSSWLVPATRELVTRRDRIGRALRASEEWCRTANDGSLARRWRVVQVAVEQADELAYEAAIDLLRVAFDVARASQPQASGGGGAWWEDLDVPWWSDLMRWSKDGMTDEDIAETWLIPALARASTRRAAESRGPDL